MKQPNDYVFKEFPIETETTISSEGIVKEAILPLMSMEKELQENIKNARDLNREVVHIHSIHHIADKILVVLEYFDKDEE